MPAISLEKSSIVALTFTMLIDYQGGLLPIYVGFSIPGSPTSESTWSVRRISYDTNNNPTAIEFARGVNTFDSIWDRRLEYQYS